MTGRERAEALSPEERAEIIRRALATPPALGLWVEPEQAEEDE